MREWIISISVLIVVTVIIRKLFHKRLKPMWQYLLWLPVLLRLLIPVMGFESSISVFNFVSVNGKTESTYTGQQETEWADKVEHTGGLDRTDTTGIVNAAGSVSDAGNVGVSSIVDTQEEISGVTAGNVTQLENSTQQSKKQAIDIGKLLYVIWLSGAGCMALFMLVTNMRYFYKLKTNRTLIKAVNSNRKVYVSDNVDTCCMYGLIKPAIYVTPKVAENEEELIYVISHENTHYRHKDHIFSALRMLCICIHWYNPLVYVAAWLSKQDAEIACDAGAVKSLGEEKRIPYGETLLRLSVRGISPEKSVLMATSMSTSGKQLKERLQFIVKKPKAKVFIFLFVLMLVIFVLYITVTSAVSRKPANSNKLEDQENTEWNAADENNEEKNDKAVTESDTVTDNDTTPEKDTVTDNEASTGEEIDIEENSKEVEVHEHVYSETASIEPTCTTIGEKEYSCVCGNKYVELIKMNSHNYEYFYEGDMEARCRDCGFELFWDDEPYLPDYTYTEMDKMMYSLGDDVRDLPDYPGEVQGRLRLSQKVHVVGWCHQTGWYRIEYEGGTYYANSEYLVEKRPSQQPVFGYEPPLYEATEEELKEYTFTDMDAIMYTTYTTEFWRIPNPSPDYTKYSDNEVCSTWEYTPVHVTGRCKENGWYRIYIECMDITAYLPDKNPFGEPLLVDELPTVTKEDKGYETGSPEWHSYWDGTTVCEYYLATGDRLVTKYRNSWYDIYPYDYVIGSYAEFEHSSYSSYYDKVNITKVKGTH